MSEIGKSVRMNRKNMEDNDKKEILTKMEKTMIA